MGYSTQGDVKPGDSVRWVEEENAYTHEFSLDSVLYRYGYYRLSEHFNGINDYLHTPCDIVDAILLKVSEGANDRSIAEKAAAQNKLTPEQREQAAMEAELKRLAQGK